MERRYRRDGKKILQRKEKYRYIVMGKTEIL